MKGATPSEGQLKTQSVSKNNVSVRSAATTAQETSETSSIWERLSQEYDIHNATTGEFFKIARQLYEAEEISLAEYTMMTFDPSQSPSVKSNISQTPADSAGRRDWILEFTKRAEQQLEFNNMPGPRQGFPAPFSTHFLNAKLLFSG